MKQTSLVFLCFTALTFSACRKECKTYTYVPMAKLMQEYFVDNYKPGNYWIYLNRDSTKRDSMWVDSFRTEPTGDGQFSCTEGEEIYFNLHSMYLEPTHLLRVSIKRNGQDMHTNLLHMYDTSSQGVTAIYVSKDDTSVFTFGSVGVIPFTYDFQLWPDRPAIIYPNVVKWGAIVFAPEAGIIQYAPRYKSDTFSLVKFHKQ